MLTTLLVNIAYMKIWVQPVQPVQKVSLEPWLTFCHTRGIAIISEVTEMSNTILLCIYVLL